MEQLGITVFDVAVIAVAVFGAAVGWSAGFAHAVLFIGSWIASGWVAIRYSKLIQPEVEQIVGSAELAFFLSMLAVFVASLVVLVMLTNAVSRSVRASPLGKPDRILGGGFGVLCAWVAIGTGFLFYNYLGSRTLPPAVEGSATFPAIKEMTTFVEPFLPPGLRTRLQQGRGVGDGSPPAAPVPAPGAANDKPAGSETKPPQ
ncbi:MAG: CvpA family protein [Alphaproteobacteria bacterium]|nr:CvpA family protein [Alphaproteobacteria bacterium]